MKEISLILAVGIVYSCCPLVKTQTATNSSLEETCIIILDFETILDRLDSGYFEIEMLTSLANKSLLDCCLHK